MPHAGIQVLRLFIDIHTGSAQGLTDARVQEMLARPVPMLGNNGKLAPNGKEFFDVTVYRTQAQRQRALAHKGIELIQPNVATACVIVLVPYQSEVIYKLWRQDSLGHIVLRRAESERIHEHARD